jgi:hypothetical protein
VSADAGNVATLGTDTFIYVPDNVVPFPSTYADEKAWALAGAIP